MSNEIVKFSNQFNNVALRKFDATHLDVLMAIAARVKERGTEEVTFSFEELRGLMRLRKNLTNGQLADKIVQTNARLLALNYMFTDDEGGIVQFALFTEFRTLPSAGTLTVAVNQRFAFLLNDLTSQFTRFELAEFAGLKSRYAKEFYRRAKQYRSSGIWKVGREEFCRLLDAPKSAITQTRYLNQKVIQPILDECGPILRLKIERQYTRRRLSGFVFTFARETPPGADAEPVKAGKADDSGHWTAVAGYGEVYTTTELFDVTAARDHFDGTVEAGECRYCRYDARNREHHASNAGTLF
ncbi:replication initiation protein [Bifidobacterium longum subsp. longum]|uniref:replication initiation protein n=1 Tax=Bifidobacterium longum TaxID=216816 RepID=UPI0019115C27|nr:replication initiation protein [Bifidobacterium longum]MBK5041599.1 replication initiation protein [Bifidobacterium longum subsp. longum]